MCKVHQRIQRTEAHCTFKMFDRQLAISRIDPKPPAPLPSHGKIRVLQESVIDESNARLDIANDEGKRMRAPSQC